MSTFSIKYLNYRTNGPGINVNFLDIVFLYPVFDEVNP